MKEYLLIVGAGVGGIKTAEAAIAAGFEGPITLLNGETHAPYDRPPLSKRCLTEELAVSDVPLAGPGLDGHQALTVHDGARAEELHMGQRRIVCQDGRRFDYDRLVLAPGATARALPFPSPAGVHTLRTWADAIAVREELLPGARVVVIGGGFIGAEVASSAAQLGCHTTILEGGAAPLGRVLGPEFGQRVIRFHAEHGVRIMTQVQVQGFVGEQRVEAVKTAQGIVPADVVIVGIGAAPDTAWLEDSGLMIGNGILCSAQGQADTEGRVFAVGDAAAWLDPATGVHRRHEHWSAAGSQAAVVGAVLAARVPPPRPAPYFWSDQHGTKIQMVGEPSPDDHMHGLHGNLDDQEFVVAFHDSKRVSAIVALGQQRAFARHRARFTRGEPLERALERSAGMLTPSSGRS